MVGDDGPDGTGEAAAYAELQEDLFKIVERAARRPEFASELDELHLSHYMMAIKVANDPTVLSRARLAYQPIMDQQGKLKAHRRSRPVPLPPQWRPQPLQLAAIAGAVFLPALWLFLIFVGLRSAGLLLVLAWLGIILVPGILVGVHELAKWGLPTTTWRWQRWVREHALLYLRIPVKKRDWQQLVREDVVLPEIREWINKNKKPSFDHVLNLRDATGLRLPADLGPLVRTASIDRCIREINRPAPGAVGLAGRRGAGKTTVIERAADNEFTDAMRRPHLAVVASAPVRYDARDFVLHLHAAACRAVINHLAGSEYSAATETERQWNRLHRAERGKSLVGFMLRGVFKAALFLLAALLCAVWAWGSDGGVVRSQLLMLTDRLLADSEGLLSSKQWRDILGLAAVSLLLLFAGIVLLRRLVVPIVSVAGKVAWGLLRRAFRSRPVAPCAALRRLAEQQLHRIRFLQTHTNGWSGNLSSPAWTGFGLTRTVQRAEQPLTHPEVVERLRDFLSTVAKVLVSQRQISGVIVAIDELDKISDPAEAQTFLNEIKGIFGVPWCLFLVSVSEDALTAFERRGIPVRDTFDSAFTTMIHIAPFTLAESRTWLAQRAIGIPEPFVCLCHCLSGGLPRELGRTATILHDLYVEADDSDDRRLPLIAQAMVAADLTTKIRAFAHTAAQLESDNDGSGDPSELLGLLDPAVARYDSDDLHKLTRNVWPAPETAPTTALQRLQAEVTSYLYFCATLLEVFAEDLTENSLARACDDANGESLIDTLCRARQQLGVNAQVSWQLLVTFRRRWGLYTTEDTTHATIN